MSAGPKKTIRRRTKDRSEFSERLLSIASQIEREFDGIERTRLLRLVNETIERHIEIRDNTRRAREALAQLEEDQRTLLQLFEFITARPEAETVH